MKRGEGGEPHDRLYRFVELLLQWNRRINLIAPSSADEIWQRHVEDCLQLIPLLPPQPDPAVDLASGGGFPGMILAIACGLPMTLVEADRRKAAFLTEAARVVQAPVRVLAARAEHLAPLAARTLTARAFAPLPRLLPIAQRHLAPDGTLLLPKGVSWRQELTEAAAQWHMNVEPHPSRTALGGVILRITELRPVHMPS